MNVDGIFMDSSVTESSEIRRSGMYAQIRDEKQCCIHHTTPD
jgi:hypothetical protein